MISSLESMMTLELAVVDVKLLPAVVAVSLAVDPAHPFPSVGLPAAVEAM